MTGLVITDREDSVVHIRNNTSKVSTFKKKNRIKKKSIIHP